MCRPIGVGRCVRDESRDGCRHASSRRVASRAPADWERENRGARQGRGMRDDGGGVFSLERPTKRRTPRGYPGRSRCRAVCAGRGACVSERCTREQKQSREVREAGFRPSRPVRSHLAPRSGCRRLRMQIGAASYMLTAPSAVFSPWRLFVPQRLDRVEPRRSSCGPHAEQHADARGEREREQHRGHRN